MEGENDCPDGMGDQESIYTDRIKSARLYAKDDRGKAKNSGANGADQSPLTVRYLVAVALEPFLHTPTPTLR